MLIAHWDGHEELWDTLDQAEDEASHDGLFESYRGTTANGKDATSNKTGHDSVQWVILLPVGDQKTVHAGEHASPEAEITSEERGSVPHVAQPTEQALSFGSVYQAYSYAVKD